MINEHPQGCVLSVRVQPNAKRTEVVGKVGNNLKINIAAKAKDGAANKACLEFIAKLFGLKKSQVEILSGEKRREKKILLKNITAEQVARMDGDDHERSRDMLSNTEPGQSLLDGQGLDKGSFGGIVFSFPCSGKSRNEKKPRT